MRDIPYTEQATLPTKYPRLLNTLTVAVATENTSVDVRMAGRRGLDEIKDEYPLLAERYAEEYMEPQDEDMIDKSYDTS